MDHKDELDLEDIVKEFSDEPSLEDILQEFGEEPAQPADIPADLPEEAPKEPVSGDTVRLDGVRKELRQHPSLEHTQRFRLDENDDDVTVYQPQQAPAPKAEPFSENWEPEYDEPMGSYTPRQPIVFPGKERLRKLREQLVSGPERRYYALAESGVTALRLAAFINLMVFLAASCLTMAYVIGFIGPERTRLIVFCQLFALLISALLANGQLLDGLGSLLRGKFTLQTLLSAIFIVSCVDAVICLGQERISCCSLFCLHAAMAQWGVCQGRKREMLQMDTLRKASDLTAIVRVEDFQDGRSGYVTTEGDLDAFNAAMDRPTGPERVLHIYAAVSLLASIGLGIAVGLRSSWQAGWQAATAALLVSAPATVFLCMRRPEQLLQKRLHAVGTVLCHWQGVKAVDRKILVPVYHTDLFPADSISMNGMKFYGTSDPDMVLCYAGSLIAHQGGSLKGLFDSLMADRYVRHAKVEEFTSYPGGLSALVDGEPVAVGTLEFMRQLEVQVPPEAQIPHAVYTSVDGVLSGVFAVRYSRSKAAVSGLKNLCSYRQLTPVLVSSDFMLTGRFLRETLKFNCKRLQLPQEDVRRALAEKLPAEDAKVVALTVRTGLPQRSFALTGAWALRTAQTGGAVIHILGGLLGMAAVGFLAFAGAATLLTPMNLLLYSLIWMIPGFLITEWTRYI